MAQCFYFVRLCAETRVGPAAWTARSRTNLHAAADQTDQWDFSPASLPPREQSVVGRGGVRNPALRSSGLLRSHGGAVTEEQPAARARRVQRRLRRGRVRGSGSTSPARSDGTRRGRSVEERLPLGLSQMSGSTRFNFSLTVVLMGS